MTLKDVLGIHTAPVIIAAWKIKSIIPGMGGKHLVIHAELTAQQRQDLRAHLDRCDAGDFNEDPAPC